MFQLFFLLFLFASLAKRNVIDYMNRSLNPERETVDQGTSSRDPFFDKI